MVEMFVPDKYLKGLLAETWEITDQQTITVHLRHGIHWQNKPPVNGREFTADDIQYHYLLGPDILVAPMLEEGTSRTVDFPPGAAWVYLFDRSRVYPGGTSDALIVPLSEFPAFLRQGSAIERSLPEDW